MVDVKLHTGSCLLAHCFYLCENNDAMTNADATASPAFSDIFIVKTNTKDLTIHFIYNYY